MNATKLLADLVSRFEALGYERRTSILYPKTDWHATMYKPEKTKTCYYGTYLNPFSCLSSGGVRLWKDATANDEPVIYLETVRRRNGALADMSVDVLVSYNRVASVSYMDIPAQDRSNRAFMDELSRSPKPIEKTAMPLTAAVLALNVRLRAGDSERRIANTVRKADGVFNKFVHGAWPEELDRADFPADTSDEYFAQNQKQAGEQTSCIR